MLVFEIIFSVILPITFIIMGRIFWKHPPKKINNTSGWRTKEAMKNEETWNFANIYGGKCFFYMGLGELIITVVIDVLFWRTNQNIKDIMTLVLVILQSVPLFLCIKMVELKLKRKFQ